MGHILHQNKHHMNAVARKGKQNETPKCSNHTTSNMVPKQIENAMEDCKGGLAEKKGVIESNIEQSNSNETDSSSALQRFLNHIPISSIPGITTSPVLELNSDDCLKGAISLLYKKNVFGAPIADMANFDVGFRERYIGFIDFYSMVQWSIKEYDKTNPELKYTDGISFFSVLDQIPEIGTTKIGELAKSFLWDPFFPVHPDDPLFHVLLLLSKHQMKVVPIVEKSQSHVTGFVTQNAVVQLLLQSSGLEWFARIAEKPLSEFGLGNNCHFVYGDESISDALHSLWENQTDAVPILDRKTNTLIGNVRNNDIHLLLDSDTLFNNRKSLPVEKFVHSDSRKSQQNLDLKTESNPEILLSAGILGPRSDFLPRMGCPVTNPTTDTLKQALKNLVASSSSSSFLLNESHRVSGVITLRDISMQFSPPSMDSTMNGGFFFESALGQCGSHVERGLLLYDH